MIFHGASIFGSATSCIVDSGTSMITVPTEDFNRFKTIIDVEWPEEEIYCLEGEYCYYLGKCSEIIPKLNHFEIQLGDDWVFSVAPEDYMVESKDENNTYYCFFGVFGDAQMS